MKLVTITEQQHQLFKEVADELYNILFYEGSLDIYKDCGEEKYTMHCSSARSIIFLDKLGYQIDKELVDEAKANMEE
jgi:hypothetical protein